MVGASNQWHQGDIDTLLSNNSAGFVAGSYLGFDTTATSYPYATNIPSPVGVNKLGGNILTLSGNNSGGTGNVAVSGGTLLMGSPNALPSGSLAVNAGALDLSGYSPTIGALSGNVGATITNGSLTTSSTLNTGGSGTYNGVIADGAHQTTALALNSGNLYLGGVNTYGGGTTINGGTLYLNTTSALGSTSTNLAINGGSINLNGNSVTIGNLTGGSGATISNANANPSSTPATLTTTTAPGTWTYAGGFSQGGQPGYNHDLSLVRNGSGTLILSSLAISPTFGTTTVNNGTLEIASPVTLWGYQASGKFNVNSPGTLAVEVGATNQWLSSNIDTLLTNANFGAGSGLGFDTTSGSFTYGTGITNAIGLVKMGTNSLTLSGNNSYSYGTSITGGTLQVGNTNALGSSTGWVKLYAGALDLAGFNPSIGALSGTAGSTITNTSGTPAVLTTNFATGTSTFAGIITDDGTVGLGITSFRIAIRRTRSALGQIKGVFPERAVKRFVARFAWLGTITSEPRDFDVYLLGFDGLKAELPGAYQTDIEILRGFWNAMPTLPIPIWHGRSPGQRYQALKADWRKFLSAPSPKRHHSPPCPDSHQEYCRWAHLEALSPRVKRRPRHQTLHSGGKYP